MADVPPLVAIKEANTHLQALHVKNVQLEKEVAELRSMLSLKQDQEARLLGQKQLLEEKDQKILYLENEVNRMLKMSQESTKKDLMIAQLSRKVKLLNEILKYKSALESITLCLEQVEQDFIVDIDNLVNVSNDNNNNNSGGPDQRLDVSKLNDVNHETTL